MKSKRELMKAVIIFICLTMILPTVAKTTIITNSNITPEKIPLAPEDTTPPKVEITHPVRAVYIRDRKIIPRLLRLTLLIGAITIEVNATDNESGIDRVEFYGGILGTKYLGNATTEPYNFTWKRDRIRFIHIQKLKVIAYDNEGNNATDKIWVRKIL